MIRMRPSRSLLAAAAVLLGLSLLVAGCDDAGTEPPAPVETQDTQDDGAATEDTEEPATEDTEEPATEDTAEPTSAGDALVEEECTICHSRVRVDSAMKNRMEWEATVERMIRNGAQLTDEEAATIVDFLSE